MIIDVLIEKIKETQNPTVVGLDPRLNMSVLKNMVKHQRLLLKAFLSLIKV